MILLFYDILDCKQCHDFTKINLSATRNVKESWMIANSKVLLAVQILSVVLVAQHENPLVENCEFM